MLFTTHQFILIFLPISLVLFFLLARIRYKAAIGSLIAASLYFYAYWNPTYLPLLLGSILFNFSMGHLLIKNRSSIWLIIALAVNIGTLIYFKYTHFIISSINSFFIMGYPVPNIVLPLGISFFTFTQTAYLVDAWCGEIKEQNILTYGLFVTVFPHLIAGPLLYHKEVIPQFLNSDFFKPSSKNIAQGITFFAIGLFKKVIVADNIAPWVKPVFDHSGSLTVIDAWAGAVAYTLQLYFDFSAYSEMAIGLGLLFNLKLPVNFNSPYKAHSIIDFWRRWHMTLSFFLKHYLYIPLGGNRGGEWSRMRNLMLTMLLGGLWHGAGWTFLVWGGLHSFYLVINHLWRKQTIKLPPIFSWLLTFTCVVLAWVFFRADNLPSAVSIIKSMLGFNGIVLPSIIFPASWQGWLKPSYIVNMRFTELPYLAGGLIELVVLFLLIPVVKFSLNVPQLLDYPIISETNQAPATKYEWQYTLLGGCLIGFIIIYAIKISLTATPSEFLYFQF